MLAVTGGLGHAFGYPVYLAIAKVFTLIPIGSLPARVNFVSTVFACIVLAKLYLLCRSVGVRRVFALIAAVALMVSPLFWWQSIIAEVYTISADFLLGVLLCLVLWRKSGDTRWLAAAGLLGGLSLGLHHSTLLISPVLLLYLAIAKAKKRDWVQTSAGIFAGVALSCAAYVVMSGLDAPTDNTKYIRPAAVQFGLKSPADLDSPLERVKFVFFAEQFKSNFQAKHVTRNLPWLASEVYNDFGWVIPLLGVAGLIRLALQKERRPELFLFSGSYLILVTVPLFLLADDLEVEFIPAHILMCLLAAVGLQGLQNLVFKRQPASTKASLATMAAGVCVFCIGSWQILVGAYQAVADGRPTFLTGIRWLFPYAIDHETAAHDRARAVVSHVPDGSMLLIDWTYSYACYYVALFEENKQGIQVVTGYPQTPIDPAASQSLIDFYVANARQKPLFEDTASPALDPAFKQIPILVQQPSGHVMLYQMVPR